MRRKTAASLMLLAVIMLSVVLTAQFSSTPPIADPGDTSTVDKPTLDTPLIDGLTGTVSLEDETSMQLKQASEFSTTQTPSQTTSGTTPVEQATPEDTTETQPEVTTVEATPTDDPVEEAATDDSVVEVPTDEPVEATPTDNIVEALTEDTLPADAPSVSACSETVPPLVTETAYSLPELSPELLQFLAGDPLSTLPFGPVVLRLAEGTESYFVSTLVGFPAGYDVYPGWCVDRRFGAELDTDIYVTLYSSLNPPEFLQSQRWDMVNYILNHKQGSMMDIQNALWYFAKMDGVGWWDGPEVGAQSLIDDALANGDGYVPGPGEVVAVVCYPEDCTQITIIEFVKPGCQGLTPGFWKNHPDLWVGYSPDDKFSDVFGVVITINADKKDEITDPTLLQALGAKGGVNEEAGVYDALARHAVAALLNAAHPDVAYPLPEQVIKDVVGAVIGNPGYGAAGPLKNLLDTINNFGGGIDAHGNPIP